MNNKVVLKIVAICAAIFVVFGIVTAILAARLAPSEWTEGNWTIGGGEPFEYHKDEYVDLDGVTQINVDTVSTDVTFYESDSQLEVILDCEGYTNSEPIKLEVTQSGSIVNAVIEYPKVFWGSLSITKSSLMVGIPADYSDRIFVDGVSSRVLLEGIGNNEFQEIKIHTVSGDVFIKCESIDMLSLNSVSGDLNVRQTMINSLEADTTSGDVDISSLSSDCVSVKVDTVSGRINLVYDSLCQTNIDSTSGNVTLDIPDDAKIDLDFDSTSGDVKGDYNKSSEGVYVKVDTTSGDLTIE